ncbi:uncharacterized protein LOC114304148, partial [Camellia sinensis]|uniref:uncharacterized protein LOC114304148 n=1 Tax=Camellia sinensis TaxID=4442 RepID=UPI001035DC03
MATSSHHRLLLQLSILLGLLALSATARPGRHFHPCKTLIFFSASSSSSSSDSLDQNPNFSPQNPSITVFFTEIREIHPKPTTFVSSYPTVIVDRATVDDVEEHDDNRPLPFGLYSSSFRDRTKDILSVVGSLLFGVGCGALTAATLYLIWSLFAPNRFDFRDSDGEFDDDDDDDDDDVNPKKIGTTQVG